jgi:Leucine-rich repeat (LRR) protein
LKIAQTYLYSFDLVNDFQTFYLKEFDASLNGLNSFRFLNLRVTNLNLSFNNFDSFFDDSIKIETFRLNYPYLVTFDLTKSLSSRLSKRTFYFNKNLESAYFSQNYIKNFPKFCQICFSINCKEIKNINFECKLKILDLNSNNLQTISLEDLIELNNLEYLNLENNSISKIDYRAFINLGRLNTLILSFNHLKSFDEFLFYDLSNLKFLNLSQNFIENLPRYLFKELFKLETIDLSFNRIYSIEKFSFYSLTYLRNLLLNENNEIIKIESNSFYQLDSIQNIFISKSVLDSNQTKSIMIELFKNKNRNYFKKVLKRSYFKSLFLISSYANDTYDCFMTLYFLQNNVHFNFKSENDFMNIENKCIQMKIKDSKILNNDRSIQYDANFGFALFFDLYLLFVVFLSLILLVKTKGEKYRFYI